MTSPSPQIHAVIFCWPRQVENARRIRDALNGHVDRLTVIDSSGETHDAIDGVTWLAVDPAYYYGHQFREALKRFDGDVMLQVQADASSAEWPRVVETCRTRFRGLPRLGIWAPEIDHSFWATERVRLYEIAGTGLTGVGQTDCIVWALHKDIVSFLQGLDYDANNYGWGIDWAAIAYALSTHRRVLRDSQICVLHPKGSGYAHADARSGMRNFLQQLPLDVAIQCRLLLKAFAPDDLL
jgi:hypothetical protein